MAFTAVESQFYKRPVIVTEIGGTSEAVNYGKSGVLIPFPPSPVILSEEILSLLRNHKTYKRIIKAGIKNVEENFSIENNLKKLLGIYENNL